MKANNNLFNKAPSPNPLTRVCVIVPVRNEENHIPKTLEALFHQFDAFNNLLDKNIYEVLVLVNNSSDKSFTIANEYKTRHLDFQLYIDEIQLPKEKANIGTIRRLLMDKAYDRIKNYNGKGIIASSDGDTQVDKQWIYSIIKEIDNGYDAVGGRILTKRTNSQVRLYHLRNVTYRCLLAEAEALLDPLNNDPSPCHFQFFGANMAVTCDAYLLAGRMPKVPYLEDMAFHQALLQKDAQIRRSCKVKVYTSDRMDGRVAVGFSEQLRKWNDENEQHIPQQVECVNAVLKLFELRAKLRTYWKTFQDVGTIDPSEWMSLSHLLKINQNNLQNEFSHSSYFGELWNNVNREILSENKNKLQPITEAIDELRDFVQMNKAG